jgi:hypothetical protein
MASATQKQAKKLASCVRLLSSDNTSEVAAALKGVERTLRGIVNTPAEIHALADHIEGLNNNDGGNLNREEMKRIYDRGYSDGKRDGENKRFGSQDFLNIDGTPHWLEIAKFCQQNNQRLKPSEARFIDSVTAQIVWREPSEKQQKWLLSIFYRLGGKIKP